MVVEPNFYLQHLDIPLRNNNNIGITSLSRVKKGLRRYSTEIRKRRQHDIKNKHKSNIKKK